MKKLKKLILLIVTATITVTSLIGGSTLSASAATTLITNGGPYTGDGSFIANYQREDYFQQSAFEIQFKYNFVGLPTSYDDGQKYLGYNDTFEFVVFDKNYQGWEKTTVGPAGVDITSAPDVMPSTNTIYSVLVPISTIEEKLSTGGTPYAINLQTGNIGTSRVSIVSLKYIKNAYVQEEFTITGEWTKGTASTMTVNPSTAAIVNANEWNIRVSAFDISEWTKPTVKVTVNYKSSVDYVQAEILYPTGQFDYNGREIYKPVKANYVSHSAGSYTYETDLSNYKNITSFLVCYDECTVTKIQVGNNINNPVPPDPIPPDPTYSITGNTANEIVSNMGLAWNLGNSLECVDVNGKVNEKAWGNPKTTKKLIQAVKAAGFNTVKLPISYLNMIEDDGTINDAYVARLQQVVNYAYDMGMYVIMNVHNDSDPYTVGSWINIDATGEEFNQIINKYSALWTDIAVNFSDYDQRLIFQSANELMNYAGNYNAPPTQNEYDNINTLNQAFVNAVRNASGSNNMDRILITVGYNTDIDYTVNGYINPVDPINDRLILDVHYMTPYDFIGSDSYYGTTIWDENGQYGKDYMEYQFAKISDFASSLGMTVMIGEYGPAFKNNLDQITNYVYWLNYYAATYGIVTAYWDNGQTGELGTALFDRTNNVITENGQAIVGSIINGSMMVDIKL